MWPPQTVVNWRPAAVPKRLSTSEARACVFCPRAASAACVTSGAFRIRARIMSATSTECCATRDCSRTPAAAPWSLPDAAAIGMVMASWLDGDGDAVAASAARCEFEAGRPEEQPAAVNRADAARTAVPRRTAPDDGWNVDTGALPRQAHAA